MTNDEKYQTEVKRAMKNLKTQYMTKLVEKAQMTRENKRATIPKVNTFFRPNLKIKSNSIKHGKYRKEKEDIF